MKRPTRQQVYDNALVLMRGFNAIMIWAIFAALIFGMLDDLTRP